MIETGGGYFRRRFYEDERLKDLISCLKPNPFELRRKDHSSLLPSSGVLVTAEFKIADVYDGLIYGGGVATTYPYDKVQYYNFLPFGDPNPNTIEARFGEFDRSKQLELEYVEPRQVGVADRHRYENAASGTSYSSHGWVNKEKIKPPSKGNLIVRKGVSAIIHEYSLSFYDNQANSSANGYFHLLSYFESSDKKGIADLIVAVFDKGMNLPKGDVSIIAEQVEKYLVFS